MHSNKKKIAHLWQMVDAIKSGQLLLKSFQRNIASNDTQRGKLTIPTKRGDGIGFSLAAYGSTLLLVTADVFINGKEIYKSVPLAAYDGVVMGTTRNAKTMILLPEAGTVELSTTAGVLVGNHATALDIYFTRLFFLPDTPFDYVEYFEYEAPAGVNDSEEFDIPTGRGEIVGISLFTRNVIGDFSDFSTRATLQINGVSLIEDYTPVHYLADQQSLKVNNWICHEYGGSTLRLAYNNNQAGIINVGVFLMFKER